MQTKKIIRGVSFGTGLGILACIIAPTVFAEDNSPGSEGNSLFDRFFSSFSYYFPMASQRINYAITGKMNTEGFTKDQKTFHEAIEARRNHQDSTEDEEKRKTFSPEALKLIEYVKQKKLLGERSYHPWYPSDRALLDAYLMIWDKSFDGLWMQPILPPRVPRPYGRNVTLVIDANCFYNRGSGERRPGTDIFLADAFTKFEIIVIGTPIKMSADKTGMDQWNPAVEVDENNSLVTYTLAREMFNEFPYFMFNSLKCLNRPPESTIIVTPYPENVVDNPNNAIILKEWNEENKVDTTLATLYDFLEFAAKKVVSGTPADKLCPAFHDVDKDIVELWGEKKKKII